MQCMGSCYIQSREEETHIAGVEDFGSHVKEDTEVESTVESLVILTGSAEQNTSESQLVL